MASLLTMVVEVVVEDLALSVDARPSDPSGAPFNDDDASDAAPKNGAPFIDASDAAPKNGAPFNDAASEAPPKVIDGAAPFVVTFVTPEVPFPLKCVTSVVPLAAILTGGKKRRWMR